MTKRDFLKTSSLLGIGSMLHLSGLAAVIDGAAHLSADEAATDEAFWQAIRNHYRLQDEYINLESGYYNIMPAGTMERYLQHIRDVNLQGAYYMRTVQWENKQRVAAKLAQLAGCSTDELIITRNTTESLDMVIAGLDWKRGDEAVMAEQDYGAMLDMFGQVSRRYGTVNRIISLPMHPQSDEEIVTLYEQAITPKTKLLMVCHLPNVVMYTPPGPARTCAIATVGIKGLQPAEMAQRLLKEYNIYTVAIDNAGVHGCRITPNVFTTTAELDVLVNAIKEMAG